MGLFARVFNLARDRAMGREIDEELAFHLEQATDDLRAVGHTTTEARAIARKRFGNPTRIRERTRDQNVLGWLDSLKQDVGYALRGLRRAPGFALVAILSLGVGIGASASAYSWLVAVVVDPVPHAAAPHRLMSFGMVQSQDQSISSLSYPRFQYFREHARTVQGAAAYALRQFSVRTGADAEPSWGLYVTADFFRVLGVPAALGRTFVAGEDVPRSSPVVVLGDGFWRRRFGADPGVIGRTLRVNGHDLTVIGVAPRGFGGPMPLLDVDFYTPVEMEPVLGNEEGLGRLEHRDAFWLMGIARLADGVSREAAAAEFAELTERFRSEFPNAAPRSVRVEEFTSAVQQTETPLVLRILLAATALVLLIVVANVAGLLLARGSARMRELAIRRAVGASRGRVVRQLLTESLVLAVLGGAVGLAIASYMNRWLPSLLSTLPVPLTTAIRFDWRAVAAAACLTTASALLVGLVPALRVSRPAAVDALRSRGDGGRTGWLRGSLVAAQVALSLVAAAGAITFSRALGDVRDLPLGFRDPEQVLVFDVDYDVAQLDSQDPTVGVERLLERMRALPGVEAATVAEAAPLGLFGYDTYDTRVPGYEPRDGEGMIFATNGVGTGYFELMRTRVTRGRAFDARDDARGEPVVMVNEAFVRRFWPGADPIGREVHLAGRTHTVVGVTEDGKYESYLAPTPPFIWRPLAQGGSSNLTFHVRAQGDPRRLIPALRQIVRDANPDLPFTGAMTLDEFIQSSLFAQRAGASVLAALGGFALLLTAIGLYGTIALLVTQRQVEIGVRMALGATTARVVRTTLCDGVRFTLAGLVFGTLGAVALLRVLSGTLVPATSGGAASIAGAVATLLAVAALAAFVPARRAARVSPLVAMRAD